jgi:hypothetical protein
MQRRKVMVTAAAAFAIGVAFAGQPDPQRVDWSQDTAPPGSFWVPGANMLMAAHDSGLSEVAPPH